MQLIKIMAGSKKHVLDLCHKHGFYQRGYTWNRAVFEKNRFQLSLDVICLFELFVIGVVRRNGWISFNCFTITSRKLNVQLILQFFLATFQFRMSGWIVDIPHDKDASICIRICGLPSIRYVEHKFSLDKVILVLF